MAESPVSDSSTDSNEFEVSDLVLNLSEFGAIGSPSPVEDQHFDEPSSSEQSYSTASDAEPYDAAALHRQIDSSRPGDARFMSSQLPGLENILVRPNDSNTESSVGSGDIDLRSVPKLPPRPVSRRPEMVRRKLIQLGIIDEQGRYLCSRSSSSESSDLSSSGASGQASGGEGSLNHYFRNETWQRFTRNPPTQDKIKVGATLQPVRQVPSTEQNIADLWPRLSSLFLNFNAKIWSETERTALGEQLKRFTRYAVVDVIILVSRIIADICKLRQSSTALANESSILTVLLAASAMSIVISFFHVMDTQEHEKTLKENVQRKNLPTSFERLDELTERLSLPAANVDASDTDRTWKLLYLTALSLLDASCAPKYMPCTRNSSEFAAVDIIHEYLKMATQGTGTVDTSTDNPAESDSSKQSTASSAAGNLSSGNIRPSGTIHTNETESSQTQSESSTAAEEKSERGSSISGQDTAKDSVTAQKGKGSVSGTQPEQVCSQRYNIREPCDNLQSKMPRAETREHRPNTSYPNKRRDEWIHNTLEYVTTHLLSQSSGTAWKMGKSGWYVYTERTAKHSKIVSKGKTSQSSKYRYKKQSKVQTKDKIGESSAVEAAKSVSTPLKDKVAPMGPKQSFLGKRKAVRSDETCAEASPCPDVAPSSFHEYTKRSKAEAHEEANPVPDSGRDDSSTKTEESKDLTAQTTEASKAGGAESSMDSLKQLCQDWETVLVIRGHAGTGYVIHKIPIGESPIKECHDIAPPPEVELVLKMLDIVNETNARVQQAVNYKHEGKMEDYSNECLAIKRLLRSYAYILSSAACSDVTPLEPFRQAYTVSLEQMKKLIRNLDPPVPLALLPGSEFDLESSQKGSRSNL